MLAWFRRTTEQLFGSARSGAWPRVRREHLAAEPACAACGRRKDIEVHHCVPVHVDPSRELDRANLISLCGDPCHLVHGHLMSFMRHNPDVREDAASYRQKLEAQKAAQDPPAARD